MPLKEQVLSIGVACASSLPLKVKRQQVRLRSWSECAWAARTVVTLNCVIGVGSQVLIFFLLQIQNTWEPTPITQLRVTTVLQTAVSAWYVIHICGEIHVCIRYSRIHLIRTRLIGISGSDQDFTPDKPLLWLTSSLLVYHNNRLSGEKSCSLPINRIPINCMIHNGFFKILIIFIMHKSNISS